MTGEAERLWVLTKARHGRGPDARIGAPHADKVGVATTMASAAPQAQKFLPRVDLRLELSSIVITTIDLTC